jgi:hypothetical protein
MGFGEIICSMTKSAGFSIRESNDFGCDSGNVEMQWNNVKEFVLDTISDLVGKVEKIAIKPWITQEMISKRMIEGNGRMSTLKKAGRTTGR